MSHIQDADLAAPPIAATREGRGPASSDEPIPLSRFRAAAARPLDRRRLDALLEADDPAGAVAELSILELHTLVSHVGLADCHELVALMTPEQFQGCLDLDIWDRDRVELDRLAPWLGALLEAGPEKVGAAWSALDTDFCALVVQRLAEVFDHTLEEQPAEDDERPMVRTPDTYFTLAVRSSREEDTVLVHRLIDHLYAHDGGALARHTLMAARSEPTAQLEEMSYRWHSGRMADLGYVDFFEALEVFRPLDATQVHIGEGSEDRLGALEREERQSLPTPVARLLGGRRFLAAALDRIHEASEAERLEMALVVLINRVLSASRARPGDETALRAGAELALCTLSLGLETLAGGDLERAEAALRSVSLSRLHRLGHTAILRLRRVARSLGGVASAAGEPDLTIVETLVRPRPWYPQVLDDPGQTGFRPFESVSDLRRAALALARLTQRIAVARSLGVDLTGLAAAPEPRPELDDHARTALVRALLGQPPAARPLTGDELVALRRHAFTGATLDASARAAAARALLDHLERSQVSGDAVLLAALVEGWLDDIAGTFASWPTDGSGDLRGAGGVLIATRQEPEHS